MRGQTKTVSLFSDAGATASDRFPFSFPLFRFRGICFSFAFLFPPVSFRLMI